VNRTRLGLVVLASVGTLACCPCRGPRVDPRTVVVSACNGVPTLVQPRIRLERSAEGACTATVAPERLCVYRGDVLHWQVYNQCGVLEGKTRPALAVVRLTPVEKAPPPKWFEACRPSLSRVLPGADARNTISCRIPDSATAGLYKYSLEGEIQPLDPHLEVLDPN
jgi:hypothetical protein